MGKPGRPIECLPGFLNKCVNHVTHQRTCVTLLVSKAPNFIAQEF